VYLGRNSNYLYETTIGDLKTVFGQASGSGNSYELVPNLYINVPNDYPTIQEAMDASLKYRSDDGEINITVGAGVHQVKKLKCTHPQKVIVRGTTFTAGYNKSDLTGDPVADEAWLRGHYNTILEVDNYFGGVNLNNVEVWNCLCIKNPTKSASYFFLSTATSGYKNQFFRIYNCTLFGFSLPMRLEFCTFESYKSYTINCSRPIFKECDTRYDRHYNWYPIGNGIQVEGGKIAVLLSGLEGTSSSITLKDSADLTVYQGNRLKTNGYYHITTTRECSVKFVYSDVVFEGGSVPVKVDLLSKLYIPNGTAFDLSNQTTDYFAKAYNSSYIYNGASGSGLSFGLYKNSKGFKVGVSATYIPSTPDADGSRWI
jgi:hypothetical protein